MRRLHKQRNTYRNLLLLGLAVISLFSYNSFAQAANDDHYFNTGLTILEFSYNNNGKVETVVCAVWYPTKDAPKKFIYHMREDFESELAVDANLSDEKRPYPLVIFCHGAYSSGYSSAYFSEYLAKHGYIVVAPDFKDKIPPAYTKQIAFDRIKGGNVGTTREVLKAAKQLIDDLETDREHCFSVLKDRFDQVSFLIDKMLELNKESASKFYNTINENMIGIAGHSLGGLTLVGKIGGHPDFKDNRIKAALLFSAPSYPYEDAMDKVNVPMMVMAGDNDAPGIGGSNAPRRLLYAKGNPPKFYMVFKDATHFTFGNKGCEGMPFYQAVKDNPKIRSISQYGMAFFDKYLKADASVSERLNQTDSVLAYYIKEEQKGEVFEYGKEPPPGEGGVGGIKDEIRKGKKGGQGDKGTLRRGFLRRILQKRQGAY